MGEIEHFMSDEFLKLCASEILRYEGLKTCHPQNADYYDEKIRFLRQYLPEKNGMKDVEYDA